MPPPLEPFEDPELPVRRRVDTCRGISPLGMLLATDSTPGFLLRHLSDLAHERIALSARRAAFVSCSCVGRSSFPRRSFCCCSSAIA